jgi:dTDP-4-dehydrorhamnose reductase
VKLLIFGANGQLGRELMRQGQLHKITLRSPSHTQTDISSFPQVKNTIAKHCPSLVVNAAAYTNVDGAETEVQLALAVNKSGAANLARCCVQHEIPLVHISTDYVFDGKKGAPYLEEDPVSPLNVYGQSKAEGEQAIRLSLKEHIIVRTSWLYGLHGNNFVKTILRLNKAKKAIRVVADQYGSPTSAADLAETLLKITGCIQKGISIPWGTYHYCSQGFTSWYEFAVKVLELASAHSTIPITPVEPIKTSEYPTPARRPPFTSLDCSRIKANFGIYPKPWQESLKLTIDRIFSESKL